MDQTVAELLALGGHISLAQFDKPWTSVRFPNRRWTGENPHSVEYADTTPHAKALADILQCAKDDIASGALA